MGGQNGILPLLFISLCLFITFTTAAKRYTVLRIEVSSKDQLDYLNEQYLNSSQFDFWKEPSSVGEQVHIMVKDSLLHNFVEQLDSRGIKHKVMIDDVQKVIQKRANDSAKFYENKLYRDAPENRIAFNLAKYHSFAETINYLNALAITYPDRVHVMPIGITHEGRQIPLIKIGTRSRADKPGIWIDGGIHAREWISPAVVLYFISQLVTEYDRDPTMRNLVDSMDWYIVPLLNPDGYEYSRSSSDVEVRLWRKNRSPTMCTQVSTGLFSPPTTQCCQGVDLNRNFDWFFGQVGSSTDPCSEIYNGRFAFSEPETRSVRDFVTGQNGKIKTFLTFHSYSQILMYPFGHQLRTYPNDVNDLSATANKAAQALQSMYGTKYTVGTGADTLYPASGGSEDWAKGQMNIKYSFLFELRPEDNVWDGFLLAENQIIPTSRETWEAVKIIADQTLQTFRPKAIAVAPVQAHRLRAFASGNPASSGSAPSATCRDLDQLCSYWSQNGACAQWPSMRERCARSCGFCT
uniref:Zinc carboxypeptidase A 1 n=1 Tax=Panagrellus redivivus TaxID=6233 RepID=A0A7E4VDE2_PANRE